MSIPTLIFVTYKGDKKPIIPTKIFVTYKKSDVIHDSIFADTSAKVANKVSGNFDTAYLQTHEDVESVDTGRKLLNQYDLSFDTRRSLRASSTAFFDTTRTLTGAVYYDSLQVDTAAVIIRRDPINVDTLRNAAVESTLANDTAKSTLVNGSLLVDTVRQTTNTTIQDNRMFDTFYNRERTDGLHADTDINKQVNDGAPNDTIYRTRQDDFLAADTTRSLMSQYTINADTVRQIPYTTKSLNPQSISISLEKGQLSESFEMVTPYDLPLEASITGRLLDFDYKFKVYQTSGTGLMRTITGMYDIDKLLYTPFTYTVPLYFNHTYTAKEHAKQVAHILGKNLKIDIDDFVPENNYAGMGATVQNIIGGLFGWMSNLPQRWINVFLRGDTLYIIQRGHEPHTIDISNTKHSMPMVDRKLMRSVWSGEGTRNVHSRKGIEPMPFDGTIRFGDAECTYRGGLLVHEVMQTSEGNVVTSYDYDYDDYLKSKTMTTKESTVTTTYEYAYTGNDRYLATETEVTTSNSNPTDTSTTVTQHVYIGNGWYGTSVFWDGSFQSSSVSSGKPGGKASKYVLDQSNLNLGSKYDDDEDSGSLIGAALFDTEFPVKDEDTLISLTKDIEWLNRKTEERISMDIWQYEHVIDFTDKVILNGHTYFLESNQVTKTPTECRQTVELVRWF